MGERIKMKAVGSGNRTKTKMDGGSLIAGISPTVVMTETSEGVQIEITDKDGVHTALVRNGTNYILTEQDKLDIAELVRQET